MGGRLIHRFLSFFTALLIARTLGPENFGQYTFVITFITIAALFWEFGLNTLLTKDISRDLSSAARYTGALIIIKICLMTTSSLFIGVFLYFKGYEQSVVSSILIFALVSFSNNIIGIFNGIFRAFKRMEFPSSMQVFRSVVMLLLIVILFKYSHSIGHIFICHLFSSLAVLSLSFFLLIRNFTIPSFRVDFAFLKGLVIASVPFFLTSTVSIILFRIDHLMLARMVGNYELGLYSANYTIFEVVISLIPMMIMGAAFPVMSELYLKDIRELQRLYGLLLKYFLLISIPMSCGLVMLGKEIIGFVYGVEYENGGIILSVLGSSVWIFFLTQLVSWTLTAVDRQRIVFASNFVGMLVNIVLNCYFIPKYGAIGAAATTLVCEALQLAIMGLVLQRIIPVKLQTDLIKVLFASMFMLVFLVWVTHQTLIDPSSTVGLFMIITLSVFIYTSASYLLRVLDLKELKKLMSH
jgi:O-antigen/teichoic acid export membrane protein